MDQLEGGGGSARHEHGFIPGDSVGADRLLGGGRATGAAARHEHAAAQEPVIAHCAAAVLYGGMDCSHMVIGTFAIQGDPDGLLLPSMVMETFTLQGNWNFYHPW
jgi:hypothetical protein